MVMGKNERFEKAHTKLFPRLLGAQPQVRTADNQRLGNEEHTQSDGTSRTEIYPEVRHRRTGWN
jgi:hypothetical protein